MSNSILPAAGNLDIVNANVRADKFNAATNIGVANTNPDFDFSVANKFHVNKDSTDPVSITGNVVASGIKISNLTIGPAFDFASVSNVGNVTANVIQFANATTGFTTTANVEIGGNISLTSNAQVKVGSNVLAEYTGPHPREPKEVPIKKYPEIVFDASKMDGNDTTNTYTQAGYTVTADSQITECKAYKAFDNKFFVNGSDLNRWQTGNHGYYGSTADTTTGPVTTLADSTTKRGSYIQLESPHKIIVSRYVIWAQENSDTFRPKKVILLGSNTGGTDWVSIDPAGEVEPEFVSTGTFPASTMATVSFTNTTAYKYHRLVVRANNGGTVVLVQELELYGRDEPSETSGDLSLDTTIKSTFNSVRSNNYVMYFDGEDPTGDPVVPKYLPSGTVKTITPNNITFDASNNCWSLDGSTESNVTTADLGFEGDVPHTVSMWVNSSNLDANALTQQLFSIGSGYDKSFLKVDDTQIAANMWHNVTYAYQGEGGSKVTYVDGRKVEEVQVEDTFGQYPPFAMKDYKQGGFKVTTSMELNQTSTHDDAYKMFNRVNDNTSYWTPVTGGAYSTSDGSYVVPTTGAGWSQPNWHFLTNGVAGHWVQIKMPYKIKVDYVKLASSDLSGRHAKDATIFGSNDDGKTWYTVGSWAGNTNNTFDLQTFVMDTSEYYDTYRMVVTRSGNFDTITLTELQFFGHKEGDLTRFPEPTRVLKYPHVAMTGPAQRGYVVSGSTYSYYPTTGDTDATWRSFDGITGDNTKVWKTWEMYTTAGVYSPGSYGRTASSITDTNSTQHSGEYLVLETPHKIKLSSWEVRAEYAPRRIVDYAILGSDTNSSDANKTGWTLLTSGTFAAQTDVTATVSSPTTAFKYHAIVVKSVTNNADSRRSQIYEMKLYGTEEDTGTPAIVGGPFAGKVANFRVYDKYLGEERIQEIYDAQKDAFGHKKSSMTLYKGRIGVGTTEPEGALTVVDEPHALEMFPAHELISNDTHIDGQGIIKVRSSYRGEHDRSLGVNDHALHKDVHAYKAFMNDRAWTSFPERNTRMSEEVDFGAWLKIQTPQSISLKKVDIESKPSWRQVGSATHGGSIESTTSGTHFGRALAISHDGTRVIVGGYVNNSNTGMVQVYDWNGSTWQQVGQTLTGDSTGDHFGIGVAISGDGNIIAVGAAFEDISSKTDCGSVRVYYLNTNTWTILPDNGNTHTGSSTSGHQHMFIGETASGELGFAGGIKLSYDGKTILMSERLYDSGGINNRGRIRAYTYANGAWSTKGNEFLGVYAEESFGRAVDMSEDGNHIIIGTKHEGGTNQPPRVEVHRWDGSAWVQKGQGLGREVGWGDGFGPSVTISNDGNTIAIGILFADVAEGGTGTNSGSVDVYHWNASTSLWGPNGSAAYPAESETSAAAIQARLTAGHKLTKVLDKIDNTRFGDSVSLSGDGKRLIVSESHSDYEQINSGRLYTYEYTGTDWILREMRHPSNELGDKIGADGRSNAYLGMGVHHSGQGLAISRDGSTIAAGEHGYYTNGVAWSGAVRVFSMPSNIKSIWGSNDDVNWTKITTAPTREEATSNVAGFQFGYNDEIDLTNIDNTKYYKYHAIVADAFTTLKNIRLYGIREKASSTIHDGTLTLTKNLVVPRIGPAFDADDTPRRDRLVVEYTTSTSPIEYGYVKDTSGNGYNAKMVGVVYNPSDKSFECSASDGSQWIETYIPNGSRFNIQYSVSLWVNMGQFDLSSLYGFIFGLGDRNQTGLSSTSGNEISLVYNHAGLTEGTFYATIEGQNLIFKEWTTHNSHMGQWYHLVMTYDGSTLYVYKNGENSGYATRTAPVLPDENCVVRLFGDSINENATHQGVQSRISNFKLYDCYLTRDEVRTLYNMGRCDEGHHVVSFEKTRVGIGLGDSSAPKAELDVRGTARIGPSGQEWRSSGEDADRLIQFHSGQALSGQPTLEVTHYGGTRASPTPTVLQISNELGGGSDWSTTEPYGMLSFANADGTGSGVGGPGASVGAVCDTVSGGGDTRLAFFTNSGINHIERMSIDHDGNVGIGTTDPNYALKIVNGSGDDVGTHEFGSGGHWKTHRNHSYSPHLASGFSSGRAELDWYSNSRTWKWQNHTNGYFYVRLNGAEKGYFFHGENNVGQITFTGQHRNIIFGITPEGINELQGMIVSASLNKYIKLNDGVETGSKAITINESVPVVSLSDRALDKSCFGVISASEDRNTRTDTYGSFTTPFKKEKGDNRVFINSLGEGAIWVTNINGSLESGDYITTSNVAGYGQKQDSEFLANYTVAKITMDCDFNPVTQPVQVIKKEYQDVNYWVRTTIDDIQENEYLALPEDKKRIVVSEPENGGEPVTTYQRVLREEYDEEDEGLELEVRRELVNVLDEYGQLQWEDDPSGATEKAYKIRYLDADGNITDEANAVHKAAFVGCTYHCG